MSHNPLNRLSLDRAYRTLEALMRLLMAADAAGVNPNFDQRWPHVDICQKTVVSLEKVTTNGKKDKEITMKLQQF